MDARYLVLDDGRKLCLECLDSAIMDTHECQPLYLEIQEFYEGLNMKVEQQVPLLLVERQALNEAMEGEKNVRLTPLLFNFERLLFHIFIDWLFKNNVKTIIDNLYCSRVIITSPRREGFASLKNKLLAL